jgi:hypothetical protein
LTVSSDTIAFNKIGAVVRYNVLADSATTAHRFVRKIDFLGGAFIRVDDFASCTPMNATISGIFRAFAKEGTETLVWKIVLFNRKFTVPSEEFNFVLLAKGAESGSSRGGHGRSDAKQERRG